MAPKRPLIIIGTSGSHDYLKPHENDQKRFWPVVVPLHDERADPATDPVRGTKRVSSRRSNQDGV